MWKRAEICEVKCDHGGLPVSISTSTQPTDQTSAGKEWPVCLITWLGLGLGLGLALGSGLGLGFRFGFGFGLGLEWPVCLITSGAIQ